MGSLAERINPDEQVLVFSSGRSIYAFAYGRAHCIATRSGKVTALKVHDGRLLDAGDYEGVIDTLEGRAVSGNEFRWTHLAEHNGRLVGVGRPTGFRPLYGINDAETGNILWRYRGTTTLLANVPFLINSGDYTDKIRDGFSENGHPYPPDFYRRHTYRGRTIWRFLHDGDRCDSHSYEFDIHRWKYRQAIYRTETGDDFADRGIYARAALMHDGKVLIAEGTSIYAFEKDEKTGLHKPVKEFFRATDGLEKLWETAWRLKYEYCQVLSPWTEETQAKRREIWGKFSKFLSENYDQIPREGRLFSAGKWGPRIITRRIRPMTFEQACTEYAEPFIQFFPKLLRHYYDYSFDRGMLLPYVMATVIKGLRLQYDSENAIRCMAEVNGNIVAGGRRIEAVSEIGQSDSGILQLPVVVQNSHPIEAMVAAPIEIWNDGIKQRVLERSGQRAAHAKAARKSVRMRRVA